MMGTVILLEDVWYERGREAVDDTFDAQSSGKFGIERHGVYDVYSRSESER